METRDILSLSQVPAANQAPVARAVLKRGPQLMVVFSGCPLAADIEALLGAEVKVGLAISPRELAKASELSNYSYVFTGFGRRGGSPLKQAIADLAHNGWSIDDNGMSAPAMTQAAVLDTEVRATDPVLAQA